MQDHLESLQHFRQAIYQSFPYRRDSLLDLLDALSSNERARTPVELSLHPLFRRQYSALYRAIAEAYDEHPYPVCSVEAYRQGAAILASIPPMSQRGYQVYGIDETPCERLYASCLADRQHIHRATPVPGQIPVSVGHNYSLLAALPEPTDDDDTRWAVPLSIERVSTLSSAVDTAHHQITQLLSYPQPRPCPLKVITLDSRYPSPAFLYGLQDPSLVIVARVRRNRVFYTQPESHCRKTRPRWYGERMDLKDSTTWVEPTETSTIPLDSAHGGPKALLCQRWSDLLMRGTRQYAMHCHPFDLVSVQRLDENGHPYGHPLWLIVWGKHRHRLSAQDCAESYRQRFTLEHFFRFAKTHLLLSASQACLVGHEINWVRLACLAQVQLWLARRLTNALPLPWQRYLPQRSRQPSSPRMVQRGFYQVIRQIGSIAAPSKPRGISAGRSSGTRLTPRAPCPLVRFHPPTKRCRCKDDPKVA